MQLGALRHFAEEWDLGVALDLTGRLDPTWEAEAAVTRLGQRLQLLRVRDTAPSRNAVGLDQYKGALSHATSVEVSLAGPVADPSIHDP